MSWPKKPEELMELAPKNNLPSWDECAKRVENSKYVEDRILSGGVGFEEKCDYASELHRFIYEYDDADPYKSAWFLHRLEILVSEIRLQAALAAAIPDTHRVVPVETLQRWRSGLISGNQAYCLVPPAEIQAIIEDKQCSQS